MSSLVQNKEAMEKGKEIEQYTVSINDKYLYRMLKRVIDVIGAGLGIVLLLMVFIIVSIAIKVEDPKGPVFFSQKRIGKNGKTFMMYKFRSMVTDAEEKLEELLKQNETTKTPFYSFYCFSSSTSLFSFQRSQFVLRYTITFRPPPFRASFKIYFLYRSMISLIFSTYSLFSMPFTSPWLL